ncbi:MAG: hypothetical protein MJB14_21845, partial [Spirochaetes bacterium]|nr:hypothetical protein [Spirochaetota bacterium]
AFKVQNNEIQKKSRKTIDERMSYLRNSIERVRLLGSISILSNLSYLKSNINESLKIFLLISMIIFVIALVLFSIIIIHLSKNLKTLQNGAVRFGQGEFDDKIMITTNDETGRLADILNNMAKDIKEKLHMEKFISKSTKSMIKKSHSGYQVQPGTVHKEELSFIFADVRGFTAFSENNEPEVVVDTLNKYFDIQYKTVRKFSGDVDDYVGDQVMAHFGGKDHKKKSCQAALEIKKKIDDFNQQRKKNQLPYFDVGIGVHSGNVVTGNIGSNHRMDFACVGDAVNTTSRLCSHAKPGEILVSSEHVKGLNSNFKLTRVPPIEAKGKKEKIKVFRLNLK